MHYQVSSIKNPESIISKLAEKCPWFSDSIDLDEGPYSVLGDFAIYLRDNIVDEEELNDAFDFLNQMGASDDTEIQNQLLTFPKHLSLAQYLRRIFEHLNWTTLKSRLPRLIDTFSYT